MLLNDSKRLSRPFECGRAKFKIWALQLTPALFIRLVVCILSLFLYLHNVTQSVLFFTSVCSLLVFRSSRPLSLLALRIINHNTYLFLANLVGLC